MLGDKLRALRTLKARGQVCRHLAKLIERAGVAAKVQYAHGQNNPPAVVASALRSSAGANKHGVCGTPTLPPGGPDGGWSPA